MLVFIFLQHQHYSKHDNLKRCSEIFVEDGVSRRAYKFVFDFIQFSTLYYGKQLKHSIM